MVYIHTVFFICPSVSAKNRPGFLLQKPGRFTCIIYAFSSAHAITCGGSWSQPGRVPKLQSVRS